MNFTKFTILFTLVCTNRLTGQQYVNAQLPWHEAAVDPQGKLLSWYQPEKNLGYDHVVRMSWEFLKRLPGGTARKAYLKNSTFKTDTLLPANWQHNPAATYGEFVDSLVAWYPYSGDTEVIKLVREMLDYQLAHGTTPAGWKWPSVPFATSCNGQADFGRCLQNMPRDYYGGIETDKLGELGIGYVLFYEQTGERKFLEAGLRCADALAKHVRPGDADHTPWPFRVDARSGEVLASEEFGGMIVSPVRLFDELIRLKEGDTEAFQKARNIAWQWLLKYPLNRRSPAFDKWTGYFEDVARNTANVNQALPTMTAWYLLTQDDPAVVDKDWVAHVAHLIDWVRLKLGRGPFLGAWAIDEQGGPDIPGCCSRAGLGSDTSRWAAINALFFERTRDAQAREDAFRSLNYATYFIDSDGVVSCCGAGSANWFSDGYSDYIRNFMWAMGAIPEFAPIGENHLLRSSSVVQKIAYRERAISYSTFSGTGTEVLRLNFKPTRISAGARQLTKVDILKGEGYTIQPLPNGDFVIRVRRQDAKEVAIN